MLPAGGVVNTELIDFIAEMLGRHTVSGRALVADRVVFTCKCGWAGPAGVAFRRHVSSQVMAAALSATAQVHGEAVARARRSAEVTTAGEFVNRIEAMTRLLCESGDLTVMGARQIRLALHDSLDRTGV
jgi:hypothetical protein